MKIQDVAEIDLVEPVREFLDLVTKAQAALSDRGVFPEQVVAELRLEFVPERLRNTFAIEGIVLDPRITRAKMQGEIIGESEKYNEATVESALRCVEIVESAASARTPVTARWLRELHGVLMKGTQHAGGFRTGVVEISGATHIPPDPQSVQPLVDDLCRAIESELAGGGTHPVTAAVWAHVTFAQIHPFEDGNGRMARFLQDYVLARCGYFPVGIPAAQREEYYEALRAADADNWDDIVELVANAELGILRRSLRILESHLDGAGRIKEIVGAMKRKQRSTAHLRYQLWLFEQEKIVDHIQSAVRELKREGLTDTDWFLNTFAYDKIDFENWLEISDGGHADRSWVLRVTASNRRAKGGEYSLLLHARRHDYRRAHDSEQIPRGQVALWITGPEADSSRYDWHGFSDPAIGIREMRFGENGLVTYIDPVAKQSTLFAAHAECFSQGLGFDKWIPVEGLSQSDVAVCLVQDILLRVGAIGND